MAPSRSPAMAPGGPRTVLKRARGCPRWRPDRLRTEPPMSTEAYGTLGKAGPPPQPPPVSAAGAEAVPLGQVVTDTWAEAANPTGTVRATKDMSEPDSLGG